MAGIILSFARAMGEFGAPLMIAGNIPGKSDESSVFPLQKLSKKSSDAILYLFHINPISRRKSRSAFSPYVLR